jgi:hypothetical protein
MRHPPCASYVGAEGFGLMPTIGLGQDVTSSFDASEVHGHRRHAAELVVHRPRSSRTRAALTTLAVPWLLDTIEWSVLLIEALLLHHDFALLQHNLANGRLSSAL